MPTRQPRTASRRKRSATPASTRTPTSPSKSGRDRDDDELVMRSSTTGAASTRASIGDRPGHLGLRGMHERAAAVSGTVVVWRREPGKGTTIECRLPWLVPE